MANKNKATRTLLAVLAGVVLLAGATGCPRKQTLYDDRPLEKRSHVETVEPTDRADPFRP